jgi:DNA-binding NarL/FixJ family response regulator
MSSPIRVYITDDHAVFRCGLRAFVEKAPDLLVVGEAGDADTTLAAVAELRPDVILLDINMPGMPAAELVRQLAKLHPHVAVLMLTIHNEEHYLRGFLELGAKGFMVKTSTGDQLIQGIRTVARGELYVDPALSHFLVARYIGRPVQSQGGIQLLTERERDVCAYLALGYTNAEVATALSISRRTVETHRASIMSKVGVRTRAEIVRLAMEHNLIPKPPKLGE